jgi:hypothetical protein
MGTNGVLRVNALLWALALALSTPAVAVSDHLGALIRVACHECATRSPDTIPRCPVVSPLLAVLQLSSPALSKIRHLQLQIVFDTRITFNICGTCHNLYG